ncbi:MAG TPA: phospho-sugar mutase [Candidatus Fimenecus excrementigallinarum]|uniref:Phosphoglucomutase n=1 Tax=Candidatus Fimenecus excrementigallinarum TaxID=2840816 RepID=A0A9D1IDM9_9FIRM|nr:phospho-sugar mutase [Candidatus Fimenecus excrementigallinarum]
MNDIHALYALWCEKATADPDLQPELAAVKGDEEAILDRFYKNLEFGTAGLRGVIGAGTNRMNVYTVNQATQGLADYLNAEFDAPSVAIAYDSRIKSDVFARSAASVLAANGVRVYLYPELVPTPMLSFAVRQLHCSSGIILTASHNPSKYNGYKCYDPNGYQMTDEAAAKTYGYIQKVDMFSGAKTVDFDEAVESGRISYIERDLFEAFYTAVLHAQVNPGAAKDAGLSVIYTPLNGTGNKPVREVLRRIGVQDVTVVPEQEYPDGNFPTCPYPNPEIRQAFERAIALAEGRPADLLLATDPDCDRVGIAVRDGGEYKLMTGNEVGAMLTEYVLSSLQAQGRLPHEPVVVKTIVTTRLVAEIAAHYGAATADLLTGFKYIGELVTKLEAAGEADRFVLGMEESYGYLRGTHARDKDAVVASMLICEMAAYYKAKGMSLYEFMQSLYRRYGMYRNSVLNFGFEGASGMEKMRQMMETLRREPPKAIAGEAVGSISDYEARETTDLVSGAKTPIDLPRSNVLSYRLTGADGVIVRPSGTEPKIKVYITSVAENAAAADEKAARIGADMERILGIH